MLRSFVAVAKTLNVSQAVKELGYSRQTTARHITELEEFLGYDLFVVKNRRYYLTNKGADFLHHTELLLENTSFLLEESSDHNQLLPAVKMQVSANHWFFAQRHPVTRVWDLGTPLMQKGLQAWTASKCRIDGNELDELRPYLVLYRQQKHEWVCIDIGEKSSYATWIGKDWAQIAIGLRFDQDPIKSVADKFMLKAHENASRTGNVWYEHITTKFARGEMHVLVPINYQKAVLPILFPNGETGVAVLVCRTNRILSGAPQSLLEGEYKMDEEVTMDQVFEKRN